MVPIFNWLDKVGKDEYPFRKFKITHEKTVKRSLSIEELKALKKNIELDEKEEYARDIFMLSFYLIGINLKDMYYLDALKKMAELDIVGVKQKGCMI